jgi:hypothetical protein
MGLYRLSERYKTHHNRRLQANRSVETDWDKDLPGTPKSSNMMA